MMAYPFLLMSSIVCVVAYSIWQNRHSFAFSPQVANDFLLRYSLPYLRIICSSVCADDTRISKCINAPSSLLTYVSQTETFIYFTLYGRDKSPLAILKTSYTPSIGRSSLLVFTFINAVTPS